MIILYEFLKDLFLVLTRKVLTLPKNKFLSKRQRTVEIMIAFSVLLQWASGEKSRRKVSIYKYINSFTVIGRGAFDNKYRILRLNCGFLDIIVTVFLSCDRKDPMP